jgi:hypothetical protein
MTILSRTEYAASKGWSRQYVGKLVQQERLVLTLNGKVGVEASEEYLAMTSDPARSKTTRSTPVVIGVSEAGFEAPPATQMGAIPKAAPDFQKARTRLALAQAVKVKNELLKDNGTLVERSVVDEAAFAAGRMTRDLLMGLPAKLAPELSAMSNTWDIEKYLAAKLRGALADAESMSAENFIQAVAPES